MASITDYIIPITRILINFICIGTILRCIYIGIQSQNENEGLLSVLQKVGKRVRAAIFAICVTEILNYIAELYL